MGSLELCQPMQLMAPSFKESFLFGIIRSSSNSILYPIPAHTGQAPKGLLKEKDLGSSSATDIPQSGQAKLSEKLSSFSPDTSTSKRPSESFNTVSMESTRRVWISGFTTRRSTTISMLCLRFLSRVISSDRSYMLPSTLALTKPLFLACSSTFS